jgi:hypothetical protein
MPIRTKSAIAIAFACIVAAGVPSDSARAADLDNPETGDADMRDLRPAAPPKPGSGASQRPLVSLRPSSTVVPVGAPVTFEVGSSVSGFGHLYVVSASGRVQVWMENAPIAAGQRLAFPAGGPGIEAAAPPGREDLMLIVTRDRIDGFFGYEGTRTPRLVDYRPEAFKRELSAKLGDMPQRQWGYARASVQVVGRTAAAPAWGWDTGAPKGGPELWDRHGDMD